VIVVGGAGQLGKAIVDKFKEKKWHTISADLFPNEQADVHVDSSDLAALEAAALSAPPVRSIVCVAGGFTMGDVSSNDWAQSWETMYNQCVVSSVNSAKLAQTVFDKEQKGLLVLTGSSAGFTPQPAMTSYGCMKNAVHYLSASLAADDNANFTTAVLVPETIDTPSNRAAMPDADTSTWTPLNAFAAQVAQWTEEGQEPRDGGLYLFTTKDGETEVNNVGL
jgi:dihydropteridine reductase